MTTIRWMENERLVPLPPAYRSSPFEEEVTARLGTITVEAGAVIQTGTVVSGGDSADSGQVAIVVSG